MSNVIKRQGPTTLVYLADQAISQLCSVIYHTKLNLDSLENYVNHKDLLDVNAEYERLQIQIGRLRCSMNQLMADGGYEK